VEQRLVESEKLVAVGRLAGGIAHEFNNKLTAIIGHSMLMLDSWPPGPEGRAELTTLLAAANRLAYLTRKLLEFGQKQVTMPVDMDLNDFIARQAAQLRGILGENVGLRLELANRPLYVRMDPVQLSEAINELAQNAREAMPSGGTFLLRTQTTRPTSGDPLQVRLQAADTGCGMDAETVAHLFEPFFTTKPVGAGPGLGLASVYGIVRRAGGEISVRSRPGSGTSFEIRWPEPPPSDCNSRARI
jgi:signal transduction histidine kinase